MNLNIRKYNIESISLFFLSLFPIFSVSIRNWVSDIFVILALIGLVSLPKSIRCYAPLYKEEKYILAILSGFFIVFLVSSTLNHWGRSGVYAIGTEIRFLFVIPIYYLVRRIVHAEKYLLAGAVLGALVGGMQGILDVYYFDLARAWGIYGHLFIGPITLLMVSCVVPAMRVHKANKIVWVVSAIIGVIGLLGVALSTARSAYLGVIVLGFLTIVYYFHSKIMALIIILFSVVIATSYLGDSRIYERVNRGFKQADAYFLSLEKYPNQPAKYSMGSIGIRLEMWRATKYFFAESPWFGVGRFNYAVKIKELAKAGLVSPKIANTPHAHNVFFNELDEKGIFGLITTILILYYPLYVFIRTRNASRDSAFAGIILIIAITIFSLTEAAPFVKGNFVAIYLVFLSVFFSWHLREVNRVKSNRLRTT